MSRCFLLLLSALVVCMSVGCCGGLLPCGPTSCNDCDGLSYAAQPIPQRPLAAIRSGKIFCGSGCGEVYVDEWLSTPPECSDPCSGGNFVGTGASSCGASSCGVSSCGVSSCGCAACRAICCWQPGNLLRRFARLSKLIGGRCCTGGQSSGACGGGSCGCGCGLLGCGCLLGGRNCGGGSCGSGGCSSGSCGATVQYASPPATSSSCGCSTASATPVGSSTIYSGSPTIQSGSSTIQSAGRLVPPERDRITNKF